MRVLYINSYLSRFDVWTGERGRQLVEALGTAGAEVSTVPAVPERRPAEGEGRASIGRWLRDVAGIALPRGLEMVLLEYYMMMRGLARTVRLSWRIWRGRRHGRPDVIVARTFEYEWTPWIVARILRRPLVLEVHAPFYLERRMRGRRISRVLQWLERGQWRRAGRIWVNSSQLADILRENEIPPDDIRVINFGVRPVAVPRRETDNPDAAIEIVFVGSFYAWHGVELLLRAFAEARKSGPSLRLRLIGDGLNRASCEKLATSLGVAHEVEFTGWLSHDAVVERLRAADIGVAPYLRIESFYFEPVKILDYMAAGLAIVSTEQGQIGEMIEHDRNGLLVPPGDAAALADTLLALARDASLRNRLGREAGAGAPTFAKTAERLLALCRELAPAHRHGPNGAAGAPPAE